MRSPESRPGAFTRLEWVQKNSGSVVENKPFRSMSDLIEQAVLLLKEKMETKK